MKQDEPILSSEESLAIIGKMIAVAKGNVRSYSFHFIMWGYLVMFCSLGQYGLAKFLDYDHPYIVWLLTIPAVVVSFAYGFMKSRQARVKTHYDHLGLVIWVGFVVLLVTMQVFMIQLVEVFVPLVLMLSGYAVFLTGIFIKFKPSMVGGVVLWAFGVVAFMVSYEHSLLLQALAMVFGYLIPGHMLRIKQGT